MTNATINSMIAAYNNNTLSAYDRAMLSDYCVNTLREAIGTDRAAWSAAVAYFTAQARKHNIKCVRRFLRFRAKGAPVSLGRDLRYCMFALLVLRGRI